MKKLLLFFPLLLSFSTQAQVSLNVSKNYPAHIVYKIDDIISIVKLDEDKQIKIAKKFQKIDGLANVSLINGGKVEHLKSDYIIDVKFLKDILSQEELEQYIYATDKDNRFLAALNAVSLLKIQPEQVSKIRQLNDSLATSPKRTLKETIQFQNVKLRKILNPKQNVSLLRLIYKEQSMWDAKFDWERILSLKTNTPGKEKEELRSIVDYYLSKNSLWDLKAGYQLDKNKTDILIIQTNVLQPAVLLYTNILTKKVAINRFASVIQFKKDLDLNQAQLDSLFLKYRQSEKIRCQNKQIDLKGNPTLQKSLPSEFENIARIITPEQMNKWLIYKNRTEAVKQAKESWYKLELEALSKDVEKEKTIKELTVYHLKYLVAYEKLKNWKIPENHYLVRDVEQKKPEILQKLDAISRSKTKNENAKNAMAW